VKDLLRSFEKYSVDWIHWKSNEHLDASLLGLTDLDLLFRESEEEKVLAALKDAGFLLFSSSAWRQYDKIFDAINVDLATGKIIHAHCHMRLTLGEKFLKSYTVDFENQILENKIKYFENPAINISDYVDELILLLLRDAMKMRTRDRIKFFLKKKFKKSHDFMKEFTWLQERVTEEKLKERSLYLLNPSISSAMVELYRDPANFRLFQHLKKEVELFFYQKKYRQMSAVSASFSRWRRELIYLFGRAQKKLKFELFYFSQRRFLKRGSVIAILGVDGAGKSTITKSIYKDWSKKIDMELAYLGTGDGKKNIIQKLLLLIKKNLGKKTTKISKNSDKKQNTKLKMKHIAWALAGAWYKRNEISRIQMITKRGAIVLCDRYPQNQFEEIGDGPKLQSLRLSKSRWKRMAAKLEFKCYEKFISFQPDLVIKLSVSEEVALARKPGDITAEIFKHKNKVLQELKFGQSTKVVTVDADQPLTEVIRRAKEIIWKNIEVQND
jgi:thymidylate kinase